VNIKIPCSMGWDTVSSMVHPEQPLFAQYVFKYAHYDNDLDSR
jgi:hypothetical protein